MNMARTLVTLVMAVCSAAGATLAQARPAEVNTVVLHVTDYAALQPKALADAEAQAARVYAAIGVRMVWTDGAAATAAPDQALHVDVVIDDEEMTAHKAARDSVLGEASAEARHVFVYYPRIVRQAQLTLSDPARILAYVLAHEIGHVLLAVPGHSAEGLMRQHCDGRIVNVPKFMPAQAVLINTAFGARN
jgi:hypothetical protein